MVRWEGSTGVYRGKRVVWEIDGPLCSKTHAMCSEWQIVIDLVPSSQFWGINIWHFILP